MDDDFLMFLPFVFKWENVYDAQGNVIAEDDPDDKGHLTKFGIDQSSHPNLDIRNLVKEQAVQIYWNEYNTWNCKLIPTPARWVFFDTAINQGYTQAVRTLQHVLKVAKDGVIGPDTLLEMSKVDSHWLAYSMLLRRREVYDMILRTNPNEVKFIEGWYNRTDDLKFKIESMIA